MYPETYWKKLENQWFRSKYFLRSFLGSGAYGAVFLADEILAGRIMQFVAIKIVVVELERLEQQLQELQLSVTLRHPHLINGITCEQGELNGELCLGLVMELADNSLESHLKIQHSNTLSPSTARTLLEHLAMGLAYLHQRGIIHRDLKPANILQVENNWKLADFGIARFLNNKTSTSTNPSQQIGTIAYMPPESYGGKITPAWDIWSLGIMISNLVTGSHPFPAVSVPELMKKVLTDEPTLPDSLVSPLREIVIGCLKKESSERLTADRVLEALNPPVIVSPSPRTPSISPPSNQREFTEIIPNSPRNIELEMVTLPAGKFLMGSPGSDPEASDWGKQRHQVKVRSFAIGKYPITQEQYEAVTGKNPSYFKNNLKNPVECVTWNDAQAFCRKLSRKTGKNYRLPSEAEWEYACRAGSESRYHFGDDDRKLGEYAWYSGNSNRQTHPVGEKKPNRWGLYDMHGNVWEWCEDGWHENYKGVPTDGRAWNNNHSQSRARVIRGGSWFYNPRDCRSAYRTYHVGDNRNLGFRVVCVP